MTHSVLVAEADGTSLELLCAVFTRSGFTVASTNDGGDAISRFFEEGTELVVCSTDIAGFSYERVCREVRSQKPDVRVVVLCGPELNDKDRAQLGASLGCDVVLTRPFRFGPLRQRLTEWGLIAATKSRAHASAPDLSFAVPAPPPLELAPPTAPSPPVFADLAPSPPRAPEPLATPLTAPLAVTELQELSLEAVVVAEPESQLPELPLDVIADEAPAATSEEVDLTDLAAESTGAPPATQIFRGISPPATPAFPGATKAPAAVTPKATPATNTTSHKLAFLPPSLPPAGDLVAMPLPRILFELYVATYSGTLKLTRKKVQRTVYLWGGFPVRVDAEQLSESLGVLLRDEGRITDAQYNEAQQLVLAQNIKLGQALVKVGAIRESELLDALREQTERKLVGTFSWRDGTYQIAYDTSFARGTVLNEVHPLKAIWRGVRETYDLSGLMSFFARLRQRYIEATNLFEVHYDSLGPFLRDLDLPALLNGRTTFEEALRADDSRGLELAQALYVLLVTDMIRPIARPGKATTLVKRLATTAPPRAAVDYRDLMAAADRVAREYLRVKSSSYFAALEVAETATAEEIEASFQAHMARLTGDPGIAASSHEVIKRARHVTDSLAEARRVLLDPDARARYLQTLAAGEASIDITVDTSATAVADATSQRREALITAEQAFRAGSRLLEVGDLDGARPHLESAIRLNTSEPTYRAAMAQLVLAAGAPDAATVALAHLEDALRLDSSNLMANIEAAKILQRLGQAQQAKSHLERVLQRAPHHQLAKKMLGELGPPA
jgi:CheY-like chemotaxis protein